MNINKDTKSTKNIYLLNIQKILNYFHKSKDFHTMSSSFTCEQIVFVTQSQLPDLWLKTRTPFDKNIAFKFYGKSGSKSFQKWKMKNLNFNMKPNYFPSVPLIIPYENELNTRQVQVKKISVDNLFSEKEILDDSKINSANDDIERRITTTKIDISFPSSSFPSANHPKKEDFFQEKLSEKTWNISFFHINQHINYGPLSSYKIYVFLKNMYADLSAIEKNRKNFMIVDIANDVYFQPDTLYEILNEEFGKKMNLNSDDKMNQNIKLDSILKFSSNSKNILRPLLPNVSHKFNSDIDYLDKKKSHLIERKNSNASSSSCSNMSNAFSISTKYSSGRSDENIIVGLEAKKLRRGNRKNFRSHGLACQN